MFSALNFIGFEEAWADVVPHAAAASGATAQHGGFMQALFFPVLLIFLVYFLLIRPQSKRAKEQRSMLEKTVVGDEVLTTGGIVGLVMRLQDTYLIIKIAQDVEIMIQKSSVSAQLPKGTVQFSVAESAHTTEKSLSE